MLHLSSVIPSFRIDRRDQADFAVEYADQVAELLGPIGIPRRFQQLRIGPHVALDVGAGFREQGLQHASRRFLVVAVLRGSAGRAEGLFEERDADALRAASFLERGGRPGLALHHLGKQGQSHGNDFAFLGQARHGLIQELLLFGRRLRNSL